jgi:hypothetical protein
MIPVSITAWFHQPYPTMDNKIFNKKSKFLSTLKKKRGCFSNPQSWASCSKVSSEELYDDQYRLSLLFPPDIMSSIIIIINI